MALSRLRSTMLGVVALTLALVPASTTASTRAAVPFDVVARGSVPSQGSAPSTRARLVSTRTGAERQLGRWDLDRAVKQVKGIDFTRYRLLILDARASDATGQLDVRSVSLTGTRLTATGKVTRKQGGIGGQVISRAYALVTVPKSVKATTARLTL